MAGRVLQAVTGMSDLARRLWRTLNKRQRRRVVLLIVAIVIMAGLEVVNVSAIVPFLSLASDPGMIESHALLNWAYRFFGFQDANRFLIAVGLGLFFLMLASNLWSALTTWAQLRLVWSWNHQLSSALLRRYLNRPYTYFLNRNTSDLSKNLLSEVQQVTNQMIKPVILAIGKSVVALGIAAVLFVMNPGLALLVTAVVGGSYGAIYMAVRRRLAAIGKDRVRANSERFTVAAEGLGGIKDVKILHKEYAFWKRFEVPSRRFSRHQATSQTIGAVPRYAIETIAFGSVILILVYMIALEQDLGSIVPILGLYAFAGYRLMPALQQVFSGITAVRFYRAALEQVLDDLEAADEEPARPAVASSAAEPLALRERLELRDLRFRYPGAEREAVCGVSLTIPANATVGIVGATGSGKTTLVDLILGLLRPQSGAILVDGEPVTDEMLLAWQANLGYVPQHIFLMDSSVAENIAFGVPKEEIDMEAVRQAAQIAQIDDFVMNEMPRQYDTVVGERGIRLSGGQRQRIGIARALYRRPSVLVFDEATSALDNATENHVIEAIRTLKGTKTMLMVAHRVTTLADCDTIFMLDRGRLVAQGSYEELVRGTGRFAQVAAQMG